MKGICPFLSPAPWKVKQGETNFSYHVHEARSLRLQGTVLSDGSHILKADKPAFCTLETGGEKLLIQGILKTIS